MGLSSSKSLRSKNIKEATTLNFEELCKGLSEQRFKHIIVLCGAGISTSCGVPDFRTPSLGLYSKVSKYKLPYPEAIFERRFFDADPAPFYHLVRTLLPSRLEPSVTHKFLALLNTNKTLQRVYTQNVDNLEVLAGVPTEKVICSHGTFETSHCLSCGKQFDLEFMKKFLLGKPQHNQPDDSIVPHCDTCNGIIKPDVVFFGEQLPSIFFDSVDRDFDLCDLLLIFGTSLNVAPFNLLPSRVVDRGVPRVYVNLVQPGSSSSTVERLAHWMAGASLFGSNSLHFDRPNDLIIIDDCDKFTNRLCAECTNGSWHHDLHNNVEYKIVQ